MPLDALFAGPCAELWTLAASTSPYEEGQRVGTIIGTVIAIAVGLLIWRRSSIGGGTRPWAWIAAVVILGVASVVGFVAMRKDQSLRHVMDRLAEESVKLKNDARAKIGSDNEIRAGLARREQLIGVLDELTSEPGEGGKVAASLAAVCRRIQTAEQAYASAFEALMSAGGFDLKSKIGVKSIDNRLAAAAKFKSASQELSNTLESAIYGVRSELDSRGVTSKVSQEFAGGFIKGARVSEQRLMRDKDVAMMEAFDRMFRILRNNWDSWSLTGGQVEFAEGFSATKVNEFNRAAADMQQAAQEQLDLQRRLLGG